MIVQSFVFCGVRTDNKQRLTDTIGERSGAKPTAFMGSDPNFRAKTCFQLSISITKKLNNSFGSVRDPNPRPIDLTYRARRQPTQAAVHACGAQDPSEPGSSVIVVRSVVAGGAAAADARLAPGDRLVSVNGHDVARSPLAEAVAAIKSAPKGHSRYAIVRLPPAASRSREPRQMEP